MNTLVNANNILGVFPHKGKRCFKRACPITGKISWLPCSTHVAAYRYSDSYLYVPCEVVHPDDLPNAELTRRGEDAMLFVGMRLIAPYKVGYHCGADSGFFWVRPSKDGVITIVGISYGNCHVANTVWFTDGTELNFS